MKITRFPFPALTRRSAALALALTLCLTFTPLAFADDPAEPSHPQTTSDAAQASPERGANDTPAPFAGELALTVRFDDNGSGGWSKSNNEMKTAIKAALASSGQPKRNITKIVLIGNAAAITEWNWYSLIIQYKSGSDWGSLAGLDLSRMANLKMVKSDFKQSLFHATKLKTAELPAALSQIGDSAFRNCTSLTLRELPDGLTQIGNFAFRGCTSLALRELPASLTKIGNLAFTGCTSLTCILMKSATATTIACNTFGNLSSKLLFYVPRSGTGYDTGKWACLHTIKYSPTTSLTLDPAALELRLSASAKLTARLEPADAVPLVLWESSDPSVATVNQDGSVTAHAPGTAIITAASFQNKDMADTCAVSVEDAPPAIIPVTGVTLDNHAYTLYTNKDPRTFQLTAMVEPANASDQSVGWSSSDPSVATVNQDGGVTAHAPGTAIITAASFQNKDMTDSCTVTVENDTPTIIPVTGVTLDNHAHILYTNKDPRTFQLTAMVEPANASDKSVGWSSSDPRVATVNQDGKVTAHTPGTAIITAASFQNKDIADTCAVTVEDAPPVIIPVTGVTLDNHAHTLYTNKDPRTFQLTAAVEPANASDKSVGWSSSDPSVATVNQDGSVTAHAPGTAIITAASFQNKNMADSCAVTVKARPSGGVPAEASWLLTVENGTGDGYYEAEHSAPVVAELKPMPPAPDVKFLRWELIAGTGTFADANSPSTRFTMAVGDSTIRAVFDTASAAPPAPTNPAKPPAQTPSPATGDNAPAALPFAALLLLAADVAASAARRKRTD